MKKILILLLAAGSLASAQITTPLPEALPVDFTPQDTIIFWTSQEQYLIFLNSTADTVTINSVNIHGIHYQILTPYTLPIKIPPFTYNNLLIRIDYTGGAHYGFVRLTYDGFPNPDTVYLRNTQIPVTSFGIIDVISGPWVQQQFFGIHPDATDGEDAQFREIAIPPIAPPGVFDSRLLYPEGNFSGVVAAYTDIRQGNAMFNGQKEHRIYYQPYEGYGIRLHWELPPCITGFLQDIINGTFINIPIADTGSVTIDQPMIFSRLRLLANYTAVPVELTSFTAQASGSSIILAWQTATETNNKGFDIERKQQEGIWENISFIPGAGTTTEEHRYTYIDKEVQSGVTYTYRLKQTDYDGTFTYSPEASAEAEIPAEYSLHQNYPNPFNGSTVIDYTLPQSGDIVLSIYNSLGELKKEIIEPQREAGTYRIKLDINDLPSGVYFYRMQAGKFMETRKMVVMR